MNIKKYFLILVITTILVGCGGFPALRNSNREKMNHLQIGMTKVQVESIMGKDGFMDIKQPYRREIFESGGSSFEVIYYYTDFIQDFQPMDTGMTPIIFKDGKLVGIGKEFLFKVR